MRSARTLAATLTTTALLCTAAAAPPRALHDYARDGVSVGRHTTPDDDTTRIHFRTGSMDGYKVRAHLDPTKATTLHYELRIPTKTHNMLRTREIKLPGLAGQPPGNLWDKGSTGGNLVPGSYSIRLHTRRNAGGPPTVDAYIYAPQVGHERHKHWGISRTLTRDGKPYTLPADTDLNVSIAVNVNTPGKTDGTLAVYINDERLLDLDNVMWRDKNHDTEWNTLMAETFPNNPGATFNGTLDIADVHTTDGAERARDHRDRQDNNDCD